MERGELLMSLAHGERLRRLDESPGALGIFFDIHVVPLSLPRPPVGAIGQADRSPAKHGKRHLQWVFRDRIEIPQMEAAVAGARHLRRLEANVGRPSGKRKSRPHKFVCGGATDRITKHLYSASFRDGPKDQTRNLEIPGSMLRIAPE